MMIQLELGGDGRNIAHPLGARIFTLMDLSDKSKFSFSGLLAWLSGKEDSRHQGMRHWLREQSEKPSYMWRRPSR